MALLAQEWNRRDQQGALIRAMGRVAIEAVLPHRRVFEQERPALFCVALIAGLVDRGGLEEGIGQRAVRVVAVVAAHLPLGQGHVRTAIELQANVLVALRTGVVDRGLAINPSTENFAIGLWQSLHDKSLR